MHTSPSPNTPSPPSSGSHVVPPHLFDFVSSPAALSQPRAFTQWTLPLRLHPTTAPFYSHVVDSLRPRWQPVTRLCRSHLPLPHNALSSVSCPTNVEPSCVQTWGGRGVVCLVGQSQKDLGIEVRRRAGVRVGRHALRGEVEEGKGRGEEGGGLRASEGGRRVTVVVEWEPGGGQGKEG